MNTEVSPAGLGAIGAARNPSGPQHVTVRGTKGESLSS